ncbi:MAG: hypothetical protein C5B57_03260, partial [Blastocatellia bacterium]
EAVGDADAVKSTALGVKNLQRVAKMLLPATTSKKGEPYDDLAELLGRMLGQWVLEMNHVAALVGGVDSQQKYVGQQGLAFTPVSKARQKLAVAFLGENAFITPSWMIDPEILGRIEAVGAVARIRNAQNSVLTNLLNSGRFTRLVEQEALHGSMTYRPVEFLSDVRRAIWQELDGPQIRIDAFRRNLQRAYLDVANAKINGNAPTLPAGVPVGFLGSGDEKPFYRAEMRALDRSIAVAIPKTMDRETRAHLEGVRDQIARILDPRFNPVPANGAVTLRIGLDDPDLLTGIAGNTTTCWPDYVIRP